MLSESKLQTIISPPSGLTVRLTGVRPTSSRASTRSSGRAALFSWMDATWDDPEQETKALLESGRMAMSSGKAFVSCSGSSQAGDEGLAGVGEDGDVFRLLT